MENIYQEMKDRNHLLINQKQFKIDKYIDNKLCVAIFIPIDFDHSIIDDIRQIFPDQLTYGINAITHQTIMQLISFDQFDHNYSYFMENIEKYIEIIEPILKEMGPIKCIYKDLIMLPSGLIMCGYPDKDVNHYRKKIKTKIIEKGLKYLEPYDNNIFHTTLLRFVSESTDLLTNLEIIYDKYKNNIFYSTDIKQYYLGLGSWKLLEHECSIKHTFDLIN